MKTLLAIAAFAVVVSTGSQASAQAMSFNWSDWNKQWDGRSSGAYPSNGPVFGDAQLHSQPSVVPQRNRQALRAYAQRRPMIVQRRPYVALMPSFDGYVHSPSPFYDVYDTANHYISSDPDPFIRGELGRVRPGFGED